MTRRDLLATAITPAVAPSRALWESAPTPPRPSGYTIGAPYHYRSHLRRIVWYDADEAAGRPWRGNIEIAATVEIFTAVAVIRFTRAHVDKQRAGSPARFAVMRTIRDLARSKLPASLVVFEQWNDAPWYGDGPVDSENRSIYIGESHDRNRMD